MKLHTQTVLPTYSEPSQKSELRQSRSAENALGFTQEKNIQSLDQKNIVNNYFEVFDQSFSDITIKNLISARLQPAYKLPEIHDFKVLSSKANELLDFSIAI